MDTFVLQAVARELEERLAGARLERVSQADARTITLFFSGSGKRRPCLLLSADPRHPRIHLTSAPPRSLPEAPTFCRTLRKHLGGTSLTRVAAGEWERVVQLSFARGGVSFALMAEMMGRWSNLILLDGGTGEILEGTRLVSRERNPARPLERGGRYRLPPAQKKASPDAITKEMMRKMMREANLQTAAPEEFARWLVRSVGGVSPAIASELAGVSGPDGGWTGAVDAWMGMVRSYRRREFAPAWVLGADGRPAGLRAVGAPGARPGSSRAFDSMNEAADAFYRTVLGDARLEERKKQASRILGRARGRVRRALDAARRDSQSAAAAESALRKGELLLAHLDAVDGKSEVLLVPGADGSVEIALDPQRTPSENAQRYFRRYKKLKRRAAAGLARLREVEREEEFLTGLAFDLEAANAVEDVASVGEALAQAGYSGRQKEGKSGRDGRGRGRKSARPARYRRFLSGAGWEVMVGKNALGNDELLRRIGRAADTWLHARGIPGSHVLLRRIGGESAAPDAETLVQAAAFAAYFSRGRADSKLPVDYLPFSSLRRPKGGRPGQVLLTRHRTVLVDPDLGRRLCGEWEEIP